MATALPQPSGAEATPTGRSGEAIEVFHALAPNILMTGSAALASSAALVAKPRPV